MKSRGILFKAEMVQALLNTDGEQWPIDPTWPYKWQTRRLMEPQPHMGEHGGMFEGLRPCLKWQRSRKHSTWLAWESREWQFDLAIGTDCPYGRPGDTLWVRETWQAEPGPEYEFGDWYDDVPPAFRKSAAAYMHTYYRADMSQYAVLDCGGDDVFLQPTPQDITELPQFDTLKWRSPLFMPRWASRITLEITEVRVQRLQEISEADAQAEGTEKEFEVNLATFTRDKHWDAARASTYRLGFKHLWDKINKERGHGWDTNPWVWCLSFRRVR